MWNKIKWPYNDEKPYSDWECYKKHFSGNIIVILYEGNWLKEGWSYIVKGEYSGFLKGITDLEKAKKELDKRFGG